MCIAEKKRIREKMSREWKVLMKKSAGVIEKCLRRIFIYANNEPKSALARGLGIVAITSGTCKKISPEFVKDAD